MRHQSSDPEATIIGVVVAAVFVVVILFVKLLRDNERKERIQTKYGNTDLAGRLKEQIIWQGQTKEQLRDSLGDPEDIEVRVLKTKRKEIWKYYGSGSNRYGLRITLENDVIVGWKKH